MTRPRVIFVNRFYWPDEPATAQLLTDLAEGLARSGFSVTAIARRAPGRVSLNESHAGVEIRRVRTSSWGKHSLMGRSIDFLTFLRGARRELKQTCRPGDVIVTMTDPPLLGSAVASALPSRDVYWVHWIQDIFPEVAMTVAGQSALRLFLPSRNRAWRAADRCVVPGWDMRAQVIASGVAAEKVIVSENWAPIGLQPTDGAAWRETHGLTGKFVVMYSGNLGRVHDFSAVIPLARTLGSDSGVAWVFIGGGAQKSSLEQSVRAAGLSQVQFLPAQPREQLGAALAAGDLHLVTLRAGCERLVFPSKLYGIAAAGKAALILGPPQCEAARLAEKHGFGAGYTLTELDAAAEFIKSLRADPTRKQAMGDAALRFAREHGNFERAKSDWCAVLESLIPLANPTGSRPDSRQTP